jgi:hypothetical protein
MFASSEQVTDVFLEDSILAAARAQPVPDAPRPTSTRRLVLEACTRYREGRFARAEGLFAEVPDEDRFAPHARNFRALCLARLSRYEEALALDPSGHLGGELLCAVGRVDEGLARMREAREASGAATEWRVLRIAEWCLRTGRAREAAELLDARLEKIARFTVEMRRLAWLAWREVGDEARAAPHLEHLSTRLPGHAAVLAGRPRDLAWIPAEVRALEADARLGLVLIEEADSAELSAEFPEGDSAPMGVLPGPTMWGALGDARRHRVVGQSLVRPSRSGYDEGEVLWWAIDPAAPGRIFFCANPRIPAFLWPSAALDPDEILAILAPLRRTLTTVDPETKDLPRSLRWFLGSWQSIGVPSPYTGELEPMSLHGFARIAVASPFLESLQWGSEQIEDPFVHFVDRGGLDAAVALRRNGGYHPERVRSESYRLRHSRSVFVLEQHPQGFVADVRYVPERNEAQVRAINERFGTRFPEDLPLDAIGVLMHFHDAADAASLRASLAAVSGPAERGATQSGAEDGLPEDERWRLYALGALLHPTPELDAWLETLPRSLQDEAVTLAVVYGRLSWLLRRAIGDDDLRARVQLAPQPVEMVPDRGDEADEDEDEDEEYDDEEDEEDG